MYVPGLELAADRAWRRWVLRGRKAEARRSSRQAGWQLRFTARYRTSVGLYFLLFTSVYVYGFFVAHVFSDEPAWKRGFVSIVWTIMILLITCIFAATEIERIAFDELGITRTSWRGRLHLAWTDVAGLESARLGEAQHLRARDGRRLRIHTCFDGLDTLADYLERYANLPKPLVLKMFGMVGSGPTPSVPT